MQHRVPTCLRFAGFARKRSNGRRHPNSAFKPTAVPATGDNHPKHSGGMSYAPAPLRIAGNGGLFMAKMDALARANVSEVEQAHFVASWIEQQRAASPIARTQNLEAVAAWLRQGTPQVREIWQNVLGWHGETATSFRNWLKVRREVAQSNLLPN